MGKNPDLKKIALEEHKFVVRLSALVTASQENLKILLSRFEEKLGKYLRTPHLDLKKKFESNEHYAKC
jgi:hypothetical protein